MNKSWGGVLNNKLSCETWMRLNTSKMHGGVTRQLPLIIACPLRAPFVRQFEPRISTRSGKKAIQLCRVF